MDYLFNNIIYSIKEFYGCDTSGPFVKQAIIIDHFYIN